MSDDWQAAIDHLYAVFTCYRRPSQLDASPTRDPAAILRDLTSAPLRELPADKLGAYAGHAMTTVGGEGEYRHFLPRIIELSITRHGWMGLDPEVIAGKLSYGDWRTWADDAQAGIVRAFSAAWFKTRSEGPDDFDSDDVLCALAILGIDIASLLAAWTTPASAVEVGQMVRHIEVAAGLDRMVYWKGTGAVHRQALWRWASSRATRDAVEAGAVAFVPDEDLWQIDAALIAIAASTEPAA